MLWLMYLTMTASQAVILEAQVGQKSLTWIRLIMICHIVPWWPYWLSDQMPLAIQNLKLFQDFQAGHNGGQFGYWNETNLAILNLHVTPMPPTIFGLNPTYPSGADVVWRFSSWPPWRPSWMSERNDFSNSESLYCSDASNQVSAQSELRFGRRCRLKIFKVADMMTILDIGTEWFKQF